MLDLTKADKNFESMNYKASTSYQWVESIISRTNRQLLLTLYTMKSKSGRKRNDQLPETSALKSARKFRAKCAARLKELEVRSLAWAPLNLIQPNFLYKVLKEETLPKIHTVRTNIMSDINPHLFSSCLLSGNFGAWSRRECVTDGRTDQEPLAPPSRLWRWMEGFSQQQP